MLAIGAVPTTDMQRWLGPNMQWWLGSGPSGHWTLAPLSLVCHCLHDMLAAVPNLPQTDMQPRVPPKPDSLARLEPNATDMRPTPKRPHGQHELRQPKISLLGFAILLGKWANMNFLTTGSMSKNTAIHGALDLDVVDTGH